MEKGSITQQVQSLASSLKIGDTIRFTGCTIISLCNKCKNSPCHSCGNYDLDGIRYGKIQKIIFDGDQPRVYIEHNVSVNIDSIIIIPEPESVPEEINFYL